MLIERMLEDQQKPGNWEEIAESRVGFTADQFGGPGLQMHVQGNKERFRITVSDIHELAQLVEASRNKLVVLTAPIRKAMNE